MAKEEEALTVNRRVVVASKVKLGLEVACAAESQNNRLVLVNVPLNPPEQPTQEVTVSVPMVELGLRNSEVEATP